MARRDESRWKRRPRSGGLAATSVPSAGKIKSGAEAPLLETDIGRDLRGLGFLLLDRTGVLPLGVDVAVDELDHGHRRVVAVAEAGLDDAGVAALAVLVAGRQRVEQLLDHVGVAHLGDGLAAVGKPTLLAERDQ